MSNYYVLDHGQGTFKGFDDRTEVNEYLNIESEERKLILSEMRGLFSVFSHRSQFDILFKNIQTIHICNGEKSGEVKINSEGQTSFL